MWRPNRQAQLPFVQRSHQAWTCCWALPHARAHSEQLASPNPALARSQVPEGRHAPMHMRPLQAGDVDGMKRALFQVHETQAFWALPGGAPCGLGRLFCSALSKLSSLPTSKPD